MRSLYSPFAYIDRKMMVCSSLVMYAPVVPGAGGVLPIASMLSTCLISVRIVGVMSCWFAEDICVPGICCPCTFCPIARM